MEYTKLGKSDLNISRIGFGCMSLKPDQADTSAIIHEAIAQGINYFDTADLYDKGLNETNLGHALKGKREKVIIATKVGNQWKSDGSGWVWNPRKNYITKAVDESLKRLNTDYIDLYQLHGGTIDDPIDETIEAFELLVQQGKARYYGISSIRPNVIRAYVERSNIVSVMMQYSLLDRRPEESCFDLLKTHNIGVLARGTVAGGLLVDKPAKNYLNYSAEQVTKAAAAIRTIAGDAEAAQTAVRIALHNDAVAAAVVGIRSHQQLHDAIKSIEQPLNINAYSTLVSAVPINTYHEHR